MGLSPRSNLCIMQYVGRVEERERGRVVFFFFLLSIFATFWGVRWVHLCRAISASLRQLFFAVLWESTRYATPLRLLVRFLLSFFVVAAGSPVCCLS